MDSVAAAGAKGIYWSAKPTDGFLAVTDDELKALVAGLAVAQDRTDAQLKAFSADRAAAQDRIDAQLKALGADRAAAQDRIDAQLAENAAQMARTDAKLDRLAEKVDRLAAMYGGVGNNQGAVAEEFYYNSLKANPVLDGMRFDFVDKNVTRSHAGMEDEFDLLLVNGQTVFVVEVKYKAHEKDLGRLLGVKAPNFQRLFPEHAGRRQRLALAAFHLHDELKQAALEQGVSVLQRKGDVIETLAA